MRKLAAGENLRNPELLFVEESFQPHRICDFVQSSSALAADLKSVGDEESTDFRSDELSVQNLHLLEVVMKLVHLENPFPRHLDESNACSIVEVQMTSV